MKKCHILIGIIVFSMIMTSSAPAWEFHNPEMNYTLKFSSDWIRDKSSENPNYDQFVCNVTNNPVYCRINVETGGFLVYSQRLTEILSNLTENTNAQQKDHPIGEYLGLQLSYEMKEKDSKTLNSHETYLVSHGDLMATIHFFGPKLDFAQVADRIPPIVQSFQFTEKQYPVLSSKKNDTKSSEDEKMSSKGRSLTLSPISLVQMVPYRHPDLNYTLRYPSNWRLVAEDGMDQIQVRLQPNDQRIVGSSPFMVSIFTKKARSSRKNYLQLKKYQKNIIEEIGTELPFITLEGEPETVKLGGTKALHLQFKGLALDEQMLVMEVYILRLGDDELIFNIQGTENAMKLYKSSVDLILETLKFPVKG